MISYSEFMETQLPKQHEKKIEPETIVLYEQLYDNVKNIDVEIKNIKVDTKNNVLRCNLITNDNKDLKKVNENTQIKQDNEKNTLKMTIRKGKNG